MEEKDLIKLRDDVELLKSENAKLKYTINSIVEAIKKIWNWVKTNSESITLLSESINLILTKR